MSGDGSMRVAPSCYGACHVSDGFEIGLLERVRRLSSACRAERRAGREPVGRVGGTRLGCLVDEAAASSSTALLASAGGSEDGAGAVRARAREASGDRFLELEPDPALHTRIAQAGWLFAETRHAPAPVCTALEEELRNVSQPPVPARR